MSKHEQEDKYFFLVIVHTKVYNKDNEFVPACRELAATNRRSLERAPHEPVCSRLEHRLDVVLKQALSK